MRKKRPSFSSFGDFFVKWLKFLRFKSFGLFIQYGGISAPLPSCRETPHQAIQKFKTQTQISSVFIRCLLRQLTVSNSLLFSQRLQYLWRKGILPQSQRV